MRTRFDRQFTVLIYDMIGTPAKFIAIDFFRDGNSIMRIILTIPPDSGMGIIRGEREEFPILEGHLLRIGIVVTPVSL